MRSTVIVHSHLAWRNVRAAAATAGQQGLQALSIEQVAARLAGGFVRPIENDALKEAVRKAAEIDLGELNNIKRLPGFARAAAATLTKAWAAGLDLSGLAEMEKGPKRPRLQALAKLEAETLKGLLPGMLRPADLVGRALARTGFAETILGPVSVEGRTEMSPVWRPLLSKLSASTDVVWRAGARSIPGWIEATKIRLEQSKAETPTIRCESCASPRHEAVEAIRWARELMASGRAMPEEIAIAAASTEEWDDHFSTLTETSGIDFHFVGGRRALTTSEGQLAAALAEVLLRGFGQSRIIRLVALLRVQHKAFEHIPGHWWTALPPNAPLLSADNWRAAIGRITNANFENSEPLLATLLQLIDDLALGLRRACEVGEKLLKGRSLAIWAEALIEGPPEALDVTLSSLRVADQVAPEANIIWTSAAALAAVPRPFVRLIGLSSRAWPRHQAEDPLLPNHIIPAAQLEPLPVHEADRRDFATIMTTTATEVTCSRPRRDAQGRLNGRSPLYPRSPTEMYLQRARIPDHAASEADRMFARPTEFKKLATADAARSCWIDWHTDQLTKHDGLLPSNHPLAVRALGRVQSATSLVKLLRDPIAYLWTYGFHWDQPEETEEPLILDPLAFGNLLHAILEVGVNRLEVAGGLGGADRGSIEAALHMAKIDVAAQWEKEYPVPPPVIWHRKLEQVELLAVAALTYPDSAIEGQHSWAEVSFGGHRAADGLSEDARKKLPWDIDQPVIIPDVEISVAGVIDRLDLSGDRLKARVTDYKSGKLKTKPILKGGAELQRCLYAYAVQTLIGETTEVEARLLYPRAGEKGLLDLANPKAVLETLGGYLKIARTHLLAGDTLPGVGAADDYNDHAFALPGGAKERYFEIKSPRIAARLADLAPLWELE